MAAHEDTVGNGQTGTGFFLLDDLFLDVGAGHLVQIVSPLLALTVSGREAHQHMRCALIRHNKIGVQGIILAIIKGDQLGFCPISEIIRVHYAHIADTQIKHRQGNF
jgi:hypothetical protein